ncbi:MAG: type II toxin-antitoxin system PemK/MazF family toxin [Bacteroidales bacterium]|nr:type II toxin-antitoxin system PemK/MazF family toxin [Bacteroidales bacterium]
MKNQIGTKYKQREIVLVPFPYSDLSATKKRPVLIISNNSYNSKYDDVLVCVITSNRYIDDYSVNLTNNDLETGMLPELSVVKAHKLFTIHKDKIIKKFSEVNDIYFENVYRKIIDLIENKKQA